MNYTPNEPPRTLTAAEIEKILPHRYTFALVDKILDYTPGQWARGIKCVTRTESFFQGHFPGYTVMQGVLILEALAQTGAVAALSLPENRGKIALFGGVKNARFRRQVVPAIAAALRVLLGLATPFAGGLALAYVLDIPARWFAIHLFGGRRGPGILLAYLALFGTVAALVGLVVPQLVQSVGSFAAALPGYLENAQALLELVQANYEKDTNSLSELLLNSGSSVESFLSGLAPQLAQAAMGAAGQVVNGFLALAASVYLLCGKAELLHTARLALRTALPPRTAGNVLGVFAMANKTFSGYIGGQLVDAVLVGSETFVLMLLFGIPYAPLISVVVAVTNIVPMLGPYLGAVPGAALLLFSGQPVHALEFLVIVLVVQQVDGNFIAPRILGSATGISGLWVLAAIVVGGGLFGIPGMVIGVPVLGVAANLAKAALPREPYGEKTIPGGET